MAEKGRGNERAHDRSVEGTQRELFSLGMWSLESGIQTVTAEILVHSLCHSLLYSQKGEQSEEWAGKPKNSFVRALSLGLCGTLTVGVAVSLTPLPALGTLPSIGLPCPTSI